MLSKKILLDLINKVENKLHIENGLVQNDFVGHTCEVAHLPVNHSGRLTSVYYVAAMLAGKLTDKQGLELLEGIYSLRHTETDRFAGCFRWFAEETKVNDTNGTFFIVMPLVFVYLYHNDILPASHKEKIKKIFEHSYPWFLEECKSPSLFYPNKTMNDGALLLSISIILKNESGIKISLEYWDKWVKYTLSRGWGWGENMSLGYCAIILQALYLTIKSFEYLMPVFAEEINALNENLHLIASNIISNIKFHNNHALVPSIRSYNFKGNLWDESPANIISGLLPLDGLFQQKSLEGIFRIPIDYNMTTTYFKDTKSDISPLSVPRVRSERVFDDAYAYTWIGKNCRAGSVNKFPVIAGSYQFPKWGLGWQSIPVSFLIEEKQLSFLRFVVLENENIRSHPASNHSAYLNSALFGEEHLPKVITLCAQNENITIINRNMEYLSNKASMISDEWLIQRFEDKCYSIEANNREWIILEYDKCAVAITLLSCFDCYKEDYSIPKCEITNKDNVLSITHYYYNGEEKRIEQSRIESSWVTIMFDDKKDFINKLNNTKIIDDIFLDGEIPRQRYTSIRSTTVFVDEKEKVKLVIDPLKS